VKVAVRGTKGRRNETVPKPKPIQPQSNQGRRQVPEPEEQVRSSETTHHLPFEDPSDGQLDEFPLGRPLILVPVEPPFVERHIRQRGDRIVLVDIGLVPAEHGVVPVMTGRRCHER
jgi:hypothetical protein